MALNLYYHPLASYCWKPLIALYENDTPFTPKLVDLGDQKSRESFFKVWPMGQFPVLEEGEKIIPGSSAIVEYLNMYHSGARRLIPTEPNLAFETRRWDNFCDNYLQNPMQKIVGDCLRPADAKDPLGVQEARVTLENAYKVLGEHLGKSEWMVDDRFTLADCSAAPALFYANKVEPLKQKNTLEYFARLVKRPSFERVLKEAAPYMSMFPYKAEK